MEIIKEFTHKTGVDGNYFLRMILNLIYPGEEEFYTQLEMTTYCLDTSYNKPKRVAKIVQTEN